MSGSMASKVEKLHILCPCCVFIVHFYGDIKGKKHLQMHVTTIPVTETECVIELWALWYLTK